MIVREAFQCGTLSHMLDQRQKRCDVTSWLASIPGNNVTDWLL